VIPGIARNFAEEIIQILGQFCRKESVILNMVFLFEDDSIQTRAKDLNGGLVNLLGKYLRIQVAFILNEYRTPPQFPGDDDLRGLEKDQIPFLHVLSITFKDIEILGRVSA
jgi:hypothetical protein